jgi:hypothetical protein
LEVKGQKEKGKGQSEGGVNKHGNAINSQQIKLSSKVFEFKTY